MITVGLSKIVDKTTDAERPCKYSDVPTDNGWVNSDDYKPIPFDLMYLEVKGSFRTKSGWWNGRAWKGLRLKTNDTILRWKRNQDHD